jgi:hypothetical protein
LWLVWILLLGFTVTSCQTSSSRATATPAISESDQFELRQADRGGTFTDKVASRFTVILDSRANPKDELHCQPEGIIGGISNIPEVQPPLYADRFEILQAGQCLQRDRDFEVTIRVVE